MAVLVAPHAAGAQPDAPARPVSILQLGDSHTAADFLTGQVRRVLQAEFGDGGAGYVAPGKPRSGVRSSALKIEASSGWTYQGLQTAKNDRSHFALSGYEATTSAAGESLTYTADQPVSWDVIEIETVAQPKGGTIEISLDDKVESEVALEGTTKGRLVIRLTPEHTQVDRLQRLRIQTKTADAPVTISGVAVRNRASGVAVSAVGFPGATIDIVNRYDGDTFRQEIRRHAPDIVVLAFGTNEGFNDDLDPTAYATRYRRVLGRVRRAAPGAAVVIVGPPNANRLPAGCKQEAATASCQSSRGRDPGAPGEGPAADADGGGRMCVWRAPPNLARVREVQRRIAEEEKLVFWDWAEVMPPECGAHDWAKATPQLMADDHVHMTIAGYRQSADKFVPVLRSMLGQIQRRRDAVPND